MKNDEFVDSEPTDEEARRTRPRREWALYLQLQGVDPARVPLCFTKENGFGYNLREVSMGREERFEEELGVWHEKKLLEELVRLGAFLEPHSGRNGYPSGWD